MQLFFILMAAITGTLLIITLIFGAFCLEIEMRRSAPPKTPEWVLVQKIPAAHLSIADYNRLREVEKKTRLGQSRIMF